MSIPDKLFHITLVDRVPSILSDGLIPNKEQLARFEYEEDEDRSGVYMTSNWHALMIFDPSFPFNLPYALLEVDISDIRDDLIVDEAYKFGNPEYDDEIGDYTWYYPGVISPDKISLIGRLEYPSFNKLNLVEEV